MNRTCSLVFVAAASLGAISCATTRETVHYEGDCNKVTTKETVRGGKVLKAENLQDKSGWDFDCEKGTKNIAITRAHSEVVAAQNKAAIAVEKQWEIEDSLSRQVVLETALTQPVLSPEIQKDLAKSVIIESQVKAQSLANGDPKKLAEAEINEFFKVYDQYHNPSQVMLQKFDAKVTRQAMNAIIERYEGNAGVLPTQLYKAEIDKQLSQRSLSIEDLRPEPKCDLVTQATPTGTVIRLPDCFFK